MFQATSQDSVGNQHLDHFMVKISLKSPEIKGEFQVQPSMDQPCVLPSPVAVGGGSKIIANDKDIW